MIALHLLGQLGVQRGISLWLVIAIVFAYAFITGWRPSAARAAFMMAVFMGTRLIDRKSSLANSLGLAALLLLAWNSHQLFMPGFQLSFAVLWISAEGSKPLLEKLRPLTQLDPFLPPQLASWWQRGWSGLRRSVASTFSVSLAAWIGSIPFILAHFQAVTPVAVVANCVLVPLSTFCLAVTCLSLCAAALQAAGVLVLFNNLNWFLAKAMIVSAAWFAGLPGANFHFQAGVRMTDAPVVWRMLEFSHGGAAHHLRVGKEHWLFDTGNEESFRNSLRPSLHSSGVDAVSGVFLSHHDADHIGALAQVVSTFKSPTLYCSMQEPGFQGTSLAAGDRLTLSTDQRFPVVVEVLHPTPEVPSGRSDDRAMVLMLHAGRWRVLWMSDAGWRTEKLLCAGTTDLRCDVLIRSQHEYDKSITTEFLLKAAPRAILCGSDPRRAETTLPASLVTFAKQQDIPLLDTWTAGAIEVRLMNSQLQIIPARRREQVLLEKEERAK